MDLALGGISLLVLVFGFDKLVFGVSVSNLTWNFAIVRFVFVVLCCN